MKREHLSELGLSKEQIDSVMAEYGKSVEDYQSKLNQYKEEVDSLTNTLATSQKELEEKYTNEQKDFAIKYALKNTDTHDPELLSLLLDRDAIQLENGDVTGLNEQLETLKESKAFLFKSSEQTLPQAKEEPTKMNVPTIVTETSEERPRPTIVVGGNPNNTFAESRTPFDAIASKYD
ncbi:phage scaffolding protein [Enterococcus bulliens]